MCNYQDEIKCYEHVRCNSQYKVEYVQKGVDDMPC